MQIRSMIVLVGILLISLIGVWSVTAQVESPEIPEVDVTDHRTTQLQMLGAMLEARRQGNSPEHLALFTAVAGSQDPLYIAPLIDLYFFARTGNTTTDEVILLALDTISGQDFEGDWRRYFEWASEENIPLPPGYDTFKGAFFSVFVDPEFARFFTEGVADNANINLLEVVWGGVRVDGIPSLVNATQISPEEATAEGESLSSFCRDDDCSYPAEDELVFGVSIDGDSRAYPLRLLNWHEMFNDVVGHAPLYAEPDAEGDVLCNFRAPTVFTVVAREGEDWVSIVGQSAGCAESGWLQTASITVTSGDLMDAPDLAAGDDALTVEDSAIRAQVIGRPVMLAYCTLCGAGVLYDTTVTINGIETVLEFGSTGLLMRSNKVMYDRNTQTAWNALTGVPAFGELVESGITLERLPVVVTDWATWLEDHPETSVLSLETGYRRNYTNGGAYTDYFNDPDFLMFPVWQQDTENQDNKEVVFALQLDETPKAYPLDALNPDGEFAVVNDTLDDQNIAIVSRPTPTRDFFEPGGAAVRAYDRGEHTFTAGETRNEVIDETGVVWRVTEAALISPDGDELSRVGGHLAFWFGWYSFYPDTLVYEG